MVFFLASCKVSPSETLHLDVYGESKCKTITVKDQDFEMCKIPSGPFTFGIDDSLVNIDYDYWIMKYEVTNLQYFNFVLKNINGSTYRIYDDTLFWQYQGDSVREPDWYVAKILDSMIYVREDTLALNKEYANHPVTSISWYGAKAFCDFYQLEIPNEIEWEKAARGLTGYNYPWGDTLIKNAVNFHNSNPLYAFSSSPVGFYNGSYYNDTFQTIDNKSVFGCYDMSGNAWEITNTLIFDGLPYIKGGGGGYLYHTGAMTQTWYRSYFGYPLPVRSDRPFVSDGFRAIMIDI